MKKSKVSKFNLFCFSLLLTHSLAVAQEGYVLDTFAFGTNGYSIPTYPGADRGYDLVLDTTNGKITTVGHYGSEGLVARFFSDGSPDVAFGTYGKTTFKFSPTGNTLAKALAVQPDGKIVVVGGTPFTEVGVLRLLPNGNPDPTFGNGGKVSVPVSGLSVIERMDLGLQSDGKILLLAAANDPDSLNDRAVLLMRFLPDGSLDPSFSGDGKSYLNIHIGEETANALAIQPNGRIIVVGGNLNNGNDGAFIARFMPNGTPDGSWGNGGIIKTYGYVFYDVVLQSDGKIIAAGERGVTIATRFLPNGNFDSGFGSGGLATLPGGRNVANGVALGADGKVVLAGFARTGNIIIGYTYYFYVARLLPNGSFDNTFGPGGATALIWYINGIDEELHKVIVEPDGDIVASGYYFNSQEDLVLLRLTDMPGPIAPTAEFLASPQVACAGEEVQFTNASSANSTGFSWQFPGGTPATSTDPNPVVTYSTGGNYPVTLTVSNTSGSDAEVKTGFITVNPLPTAAFSSLVNGASVAFTNASSDAVSYSWNFGDGQSGTTASPTHLYSASGDYTVTLTATNDCGTNTSTAVVSVVIIVAPQASFTVSENSGCFPLVVQMTDQSTNGPTAWEWQFPGGNPATSTQQNPSVTYASPGTYSVMLTVSNLAGTSTATMSSVITVLGLPTADFEFTIDQGLVTFTNHALNGDSYVWDFGDGDTSHQENPVHLYTSSGIYTARLTVTNACGASLLEQMIELLIIAAEEPAWLEQARLFPNPNIGKFTLTVSGTSQPVLGLALFNPLGQLLRTDRVDFRSGELKQSFDLQSQPNGIYLLKLSAENEPAKWWRVVVQR